MAALRNADSQRTFIRSNRDWLYRTQRAWQSLLAEWDVAGIGFDEGILQLLNRSYQFLAPRFMPVTEWASRTRPAKRKQDDGATDGVVITPGSACSPRGRTARGRCSRRHPARCRAR